MNDSKKPSLFTTKFVVINTFTPIKLHLKYVILPNIGYFKITKNTT